MLQPDKKVLLYGLGLLACIAAFHISVFIYWPYAELSKVIAVFNAERSWLQNFNVYKLSEASYLFVKTGYFTLFILALAFLYFLNFRLSAFRPGTLVSLVKKIGRVWTELPRAEKIIFLITGTGLLLVRVYFLGEVRLHVDESSNYLCFLRKGLPGVIFYYPIPNNHVLYSLLCLLLKQIFTNSFWILKLPAFLLSCISTGLFYLALRSVFPFVIAYVVTFGISFSYYALYFSVYGRGYFLMLICYFLAFIALIKLTENKEGGYWLVFLIATVAGFYTLPVFIYPFIPLFLFGLVAFIKVGNKAGLVNLLVITFFAALATLLLYVPIMVVSGPHQLFGNVYVTQVLTTKEYFTRLPVNLMYMQGALLGQETIGFSGWFIASLFLCFLVLFRKRFLNFWVECGFKPDYLLLVFLSSLIPWVLMALQKVYPPERVWLFKTLPDFLIIAFCLHALSIIVLKKKVNYVLISCACLILLYGSYEVLKLYRSLPENSGKSSAGEAPGLGNYIQKDRKDKAISSFKSRFFLYQNAGTMNVKLLIDEERRDKSKEYDLIMLDRLDPDSMFFDQDKYHLVFDGKEFKVFERK